MDFEALVAAKVAEGRWSERQARIIVRAALLDAAEEEGLAVDRFRWDEIHEAWVPKD